MTNELVHVRTPTYRRNDYLKRALQSLIAQDHENWVCEVFDDDPDGGGEMVVDELSDSRIKYCKNPVQNFASKNIDKCFSKNNPYDADYFFVLEDDNFILDRFISENIRILKDKGVKLLMRNQFIELNSGTIDAKLSDFGVMDSLFVDRVYQKDEFRVSLLLGIGVSNGGMFWSKDAETNLEIEYNCTATFQEYMRTFLIREPIYAAMKPLAVWAENGAQTVRDLGTKLNTRKKVIDESCNIGILRKNIWLHLGQYNNKYDILSKNFNIQKHKLSLSLFDAGMPFTALKYFVYKKSRFKPMVRGLIYHFLGKEYSWLKLIIENRNLL